MDSSVERRFHYILEKHVQVVPEQGQRHLGLDFTWDKDNELKMFIGYRILGY